MHNFHISDKNMNFIETVRCLVPGWKGESLHMLVQLSLVLWDELDWKSDETLTMGGTPFRTFITLSSQTILLDFGIFYFYPLSHYISHWRCNRSSHCQQEGRQRKQMAGPGLV